MHLQKAFDTVDLTILHMKKFFFFFMKLQASAIGKDILTWFKSISDRQQLVDVAGNHSTTAPGTYGVLLRFI
jgi:hypothetical protein